MLTGLPPFYTKNRKDLFDKIQKVNIKFPQWFSPELKDLLSKLFVKNPDKRLGGGPRGAEDIKEHPWFNMVNWQLLLEKRYQPPFVPILQNELDLKYFDAVIIYTCFHFIMCLGVYRGTDTFNEQ